MPRRAAPRTNLPVERGSFVGRLKLLDEIARQVDGGARLVSLVGPEGIGKTRLALRAAAMELPRFGSRGGVWFVDAVEITSGAGLVRELLLVLGLLPEPGAGEANELARAAGAFNEAGPTLAVIDGAGAALAASLSAVLAAAPELRVLVTAREPLFPVVADVSRSLPPAPIRSQDGGDFDERVVKVGPLKLAKHSQQDARSIAAAEAVALFVERAAEAKRGFLPTPAELHAIAQIVRQLDGVPLAIEIAAARLRALSASELLERLPRRVGLLVGGNGSASQRAALAGAVAWSLDLLPPWEQSALAQAAVFRGGFDAAAAVAVVDLSPFSEAPSVDAALESLLEKALLRVQDLPARFRGDDVPEDEKRLDMPSVVRELIDARLGHDVAREALANRHAAHYLSVCSKWAEGVDGHGGLTLRRKLELETDNLVAAVRRALASDPQNLASITTALRGALALEPVLTTRGPHELFLDLLDRALEPADIVGVGYALRARAYEARGRARRARHELSGSLADLESALSCARRAKDKLLEARALANIGTHHLHIGRLDLADVEYKGALRLLDEVGERKVYGRALGYCGLLDSRKGDLPAAVRRFQEALLVQRDVGDRRWEGINEAQLGHCLLELGQLEDARSHIKRGLAIHKELHNRRFEAIALTSLGDLDVACGEVDEARTLWERARALHRQVGDPRGEAVTLARLAALAKKRGVPSVAAELFGRARELIDRLDDPALIEMLALFEDRIPLSQAGTSEPARAAARILHVIA